MNNKEFSQLVATIQSAYPNRQVASTKEDLQVWFNFLKDSDYAKVMSRLVNHIKASNFTPSISELIVEEVKVNIPGWRIDWLKIMKHPLVVYHELSNAGKFAYESLGQNYIYNALHDDSCAAGFCMKEFMNAFNDFENTTPGIKKELCDIAGISMFNREQIVQKQDEFYWIRKKIGDIKYDENVLGKLMDYAIVIRSKICNELDLKTSDDNIGLNLICAILYSCKKTEAELNDLIEKCINDSKEQGNYGDEFNHWIVSRLGNIIK